MRLISRFRFHLSEFIQRPDWSKTLHQMSLGCRGVLLKKLKMKKNGDSREVLVGFRKNIWLMRSEILA